MKKNRIAASSFSFSFPEGKVDGMSSTKKKLSSGIMYLPNFSMLSMCRAFKISTSTS